MNALNPYEAANAMAQAIQPRLKCTATTIGAWKVWRRAFRRALVSNLGKNPEPRLIIYLNQGSGDFEEVIIERGIPTHEAKVADLTGDGRPDIVGKPYQPERHIDVWLNDT